VKAFWRVLLVKMSHSLLGIIWTSAQLNTINISRYCINSYIKVVTPSVGIPSAQEPSYRSLTLFHNDFMALNFAPFLRRPRWLHWAKRPSRPWITIHGNRGISWYTAWQYNVDFVPVTLSVVSRKILVLFFKAQYSFWLIK
jgi:hypothetical protein